MLEVIMLCVRWWGLVVQCLRGYGVMDNVSLVKIELIRTNLKIFVRKPELRKLFELRVVSIPQNLNIHKYLKLVLSNFVS